MKKIYILAAVLAIIAGISVYLFASAIQLEANKPDEEMSSVVVAISDIPENTLITAEMVILRSVPISGVHPLAVTSLEEIIGSITQQPITHQEQVLGPKLGEQGDESDEVAYRLEPGQRAISIGVDEVSGVSGFIEPGNYVDVIATLIYPAVGVDNPQLTASTMLVQNLKVLEIGMKITGPADSNSATYETITISATPDECVKINYAATNGQIRVVLRPVLDKYEVDVPNYHPKR